MKRSLSVVAKFTVTALAIAIALMLPVPAAYAIPITFVGSLTGANEVPPVPSPGTGLATVVLSCPFARDGPRNGGAGFDGPNDTDKRDV